MATKSQRPKGRDGTLSLLNTAIEALNLAKEVSAVTPAKAIFGSASVILVMIRVGFLLVYVERLQSEMDLGLDDQRGGLCRTWIGLR